jgi:hypothetical protein
MAGIIDSQNKINKMMKSANKVEEGRAKAQEASTNNWLKTLHPDDLEIYNAMTPGEKAFAETLQSTPGGHEREQFIRSTPEDRAKIMGSFKQADEEAYKTQGQGVKVDKPIVKPLPEEAYNDTQTSEQEAATIKANKAPQQDSYQSFADYVTAKNKDGGSGIRDYLIADALATFARNTGKDIGNVAAAYSGGTMNNDRETSLLEKRLAQKAQAETEQQIGSEYANSRLGQELRARGLDIDTQAGRLAMANNVKAAMYDENGKLKYPADSPAYRDLATLYGQLTSGGGSRDSILSGFARLLNQGISLFW